MSRSPLLMAALAIGVVATTAYAAWYVNPDGTGFAGKGDVQLIYGWNNKALQQNAGSVMFRMASAEVTTWSCTNTKNEQVQERTRTTTLQGLVSNIARERNQITGFNLTGLSGAPTTTTEGPPLNSCPTNWVHNGDTQTVPSGATGLEVSIDGAEWFPL